MKLETNDIVLAAALQVLDYQLLAIEKRGNKGTFIFDEVPDDVIDDYDLGKMLVCPRKLNTGIKALTTACNRKLK